MTKDRKQALLKLLKEAPKLSIGQTLAEHFHVTRQSLYRTSLFSEQMELLSYPPIVAISTKKMMPAPTLHKLFKVKHELEEIGQELLLL